MRRRVAVLVVLAFILSGCMQGPNETNGTNETQPPDPGNGQDPPPEDVFRPTITDRASALVWLNDSHGADSIRIYESESQHEKNDRPVTHDYCEPPLWTLLVWNQTGLADFQYQYHPRGDPLNWSIPLPPEPPYLFFVTQPCFAYMSFELPVDVNATTAVDTWGKPGNKGRPFDPLIVVKDITHEIELVFPPGALEAEAVFPKSPYHVRMQEGLIPGHVSTEGHPFGDIWEYDPIAQGGDDWKTHVRMDEVNSYWEAQRLQHGQAGDYVFKGRLDTPWPNQTTWRIELDVWEINPPELAKLGFEEELRYWL